MGAEIILIVIGVLLLLAGLKKDYYALNTLENIGGKIFISVGLYIIIRGITNLIIMLGGI